MSTKDERDPWLVATDISMHFGGVNALQGVDISLAPGDRLGLIGPNGSGKTTLLNVLSGVYRATAGSIRVEGKEIVSANAGRRARLGIVRTFQHPQLAASLSIEENIALGVRLAKRRGVGNGLDAAGAMSLFRCSAYAQRRPDEVPYGIRKMAEVARAASAMPRLLLLDEPAAGLSGEERLELVEALNGFVDEHPLIALGLVEHDVPLVSQVCRDILVLNAGQSLAVGEAGTVLQDPAVREAYLGTSQNHTSTARSHRPGVHFEEAVDA